MQPTTLQSREGPGHCLVGVDVARFGADRTAICVQQNNTVIALDAYHRQNTMETAGRVAAAIHEYNPKGVRIDEIGVGAGVVDRLKELGYDCIEGVNVSNRATDPDKFANLRAELFDNLRELFDRQQIEIPNDPDLISQLTSIRYSFASTGQIKIEDKETLRRNGLPSPDLADALVLAFAPETERPAYKIFTGSPLERPQNQHRTPAARLSLLAQEGVDLDTLTIHERRRYNNWIDTGSWGPSDAQS